MDPATLYAAPVSLYSGKARSYLIKAGIPYREEPPGSPHFVEQVLPKAAGMSMPTIELADGRVIRDSTKIIDHFEAETPRFTPTTPCQSVISLLFDVIGSEGLLRPAMHYRWNFPEHNDAFIRRHFEQVAPAGIDATQMATMGMQRMRAAAVAFGVTPENFGGIEALYEGLLPLLDAHFAEHGYLLGGKPSIGDFGLVAPLYAHLGRDPYSLQLMQSKALHLFRWVERMNRPELDTGEFRAASPELLPGDEVAETLVAVLRHVAKDFVPETVAAARHINAFLTAQPPAAGSPIPRAVEGLAAFEASGMKLQAIAQPYRFYLLNRVHERVGALSGADRDRVAQLLTRCDLAPLLDARLERAIDWKDNQGIWGA